MLSHPRAIFRVGCAILVFTALAHVLGHVSLAAQTGEDETHRQLLALMKGYRREIGGSMRSTWDFFLGFSLHFSISLLGLGAAGWAGTVGGRRPGALALVFTLVSGAALANSVAYFFIAPTVCLAAATLAFALATVAERLTTST
ncbi:MAG: hypothetical protein JNM07_12640 [Phycisphaerae bacterium]|nr:hypothetical protein [Phycisphaerae bacterium]